MRLMTAVAVKVVSTDETQSATSRYSRAGPGAKGQRVDGDEQGAGGEREALHPAHARHAVDVPVDHVPDERVVHGVEHARHEEQQAGLPARDVRDVDEEVQRPGVEDDAADDQPRFGGRDAHLVAEREGAAARPPVCLEGARHAVPAVCASDLIGPIRTQDV
jgi:hypothetical protein